MIFVDSSFYVAIAISSDPHNAKASGHFPTVKDQQITSEDVLKETLTIVSQRLGKAECIKFYEDLLPTVNIIPITHERFTSGLKIFLNPNLPKDISLVDCISAALCKELHFKKILTFDSHFRALGLRPTP